MRRYLITALRTETMLRNTFFSAVSILMLGASSASASIVLNGGFETGDFSGWTETSTDAIPFPFVVQGSTVHSGTYAAALNGDPGENSITQTLATTAGQFYTFSFWLDHPYTDNGPSDFSALWNGSPVLQLTSPLSNFTWTQYSFTVQATNNSTPIEFTSREVPAYTYLDDITVDATDVPGDSVAPEPSALIIWSLLGVAGVALRYWRRRKAA
jgi:hypothetical protein